MGTRNYSMTKQYEKAKRLLEPHNSPIRDLLARVFDGDPSLISISTMEQDLRGIDVLVPGHDSAGKDHVFFIDLKNREKDWKRRDMALELWSVMEKQKIGWTLDRSKWTEFVLAHWEDTHNIFLVPFRPLLEAFERNKERWCDLYKTDIQFTAPDYPNGGEAHCPLCRRPHVSGGWHSQAVFVPLDEIVKEVLVDYPTARFRRGNLYRSTEALLIDPLPPPFQFAPSAYVERAIEKALSALPGRLSFPHYRTRELNFKVAVPA